MKKTMSAVVAGSVLLAATSLQAQGAVEGKQCATVRLGDPGWSDIAVTNGIASLLLEGLGYKPKVMTLGVPIIFAGLTKNQLDVFLGNWMPAQQDNYDKFVATAEIDEHSVNLTGTEYTLAVPTSVWNAGVKRFEDLDKHAKLFDKTIYGIAAGAPANLSIQKMIDQDEFGLGDWRLVESSEQAMLVQVGRAVRRDKGVAFLGWTPHPMNVQHDIKYLKGGEAYFGDSGTVNTLVRKGYAAQCPNVGKLLSNLKFTQDMENAIMDEVLARNASNEAAVKAWVKDHPEVLESWLQGVTTREGEEGLAAVKASL